MADLPRPRCDACAFGVAAGSGDVDAREVGELIECRRFPPTIRSQGAEFPTVEETDWCGEWAAAGEEMVPL